MKKVLTILVVLTLVAGFAFADKASETHTLTISATVDSAIPQFQLFKGDVKTNDTPNGFDNEAVSYTGTAAAGFKLDLGGTVTFVAKVANQAKQKQNYSLTFSDGEFDVKRDGADETQAPTITVTKNNTTTDGVTLSQENGSKTVIAAFTGAKMTESGYTIATAEYAYAADSTIDPGTYYADVVLTVSAV